MSNLANTIQYLRAKDNRFITITIQETNKSIGKANVYLADIPGEDLEQYIKSNLGPITKPTLVWVEMRTKQGPTSKKDHACAIEISPVNYLPETTAQNATSVPAIAPVHYPQPIPQDNTPSFLGNPNAGNVFGLGLADVMGMQRKADRLIDREEQLADLKEEHRELKQKHNLLEQDHRDALTKLSVAEEKKDIAISKVLSENKSFADSPAFATLMEKAPELIGAFVTMKTGGAALPVAGVLGSPMPDGHKEFVEHVVENLDENQVNLLGAVCHYLNNDGFVAQLQMIIQQYSAITHA